MNVTCLGKNDSFILPRNLSLHYAPFIRSSTTILQYARNQGEEWPENKFKGEHFSQLSLV